ncbi:hypothetical protein [Rahnella sikkimica]|uniref:Uncharacterized protein n=1 Tax=Rahnella sikkimica TaxID=1805933 RepID=A0A2L1UTI9_9GAMM|nr:hypothetical protein [Rahnella sikkimica]AVF36276.1 hypothetical protein BV494_15665 [Rahnella sikkimica]
MQYLNGDTVHINDEVQLWEGCRGIVVCSVDTNEYSDEYPEIEWRDELEKGVLILSDQTGLIHYEEPDQDLILIKRDSMQYKS